MRSPLGVIIFLSLLILLDLYVFQAVKAVSRDASMRTRSIITYVWFGVTVISVIGFLLFVYTDQHVLGKQIRTYLFAIILGLFIAKLACVIFLITDDLRRGLQWIASKIFFRPAEQDVMKAEQISRSVFLSWVGLAVGGTLFGTLLYGFSNKYDYRIKRLKLRFANLPASFRGLRILQMSDIHSGSFTNKQAVNRGIDKILAEHADIILFTGDLVNDRATEMREYMDIFSRLKAPMGVYSVFGNHDYGDYVAWPDEGVSKQQNLVNLAKVHKDLGWDLLMNEHRVFTKGADSIALIGIENWSAKGRFPKHGRMDFAYPGTEKIPFKILMSHDPSHWEAQVIPDYSDIDLTLSGHTHGMQFGVEIAGIKWSPVQYMYKQWHGLYESGKQKLYVNPGYGFIGYPGRVGVLPEITVIELV